MRLARTMGLVATAGLLACGPSDDEALSPGGEEREACIPREADPGEGGDRVLELGTGSGDAWRPLADGDEAPLVWGHQGGLMLQPVLRLEATTDDPERSCLEVDLDYTFDPELHAGEVSRGTLTFAWFERFEAGLYSPPLDALLGWDASRLDGVVLHLDARVDGALGAGDQRRTVHLVAPDE